MGSSRPVTLGNASFDDTACAFIAGTVPEMLASLAERIRQLIPAVCRIGMFLTDARGTELQRWVDSDGRVLPCPAELSSLDANAALGRCRAAAAPHANGLRADPALEWAGSNDSWPLIAFPIASRYDFSGFLIVEARAAIRISRAAMRALTDWGPFAAAVVAGGIKSMRRLVGAVRFSRDFTLMRDRDTGEHQVRLGAYLHILAIEMSRAHGLPDGFADELTVFGQLHDIGKVGIGDDVLLKPGGFDPLEWEQMKEHVNKGSELVRQMSDDLCLADTPGLETLQAVVAFHHEYLDGSGYPEGRRGDEIPLAARMVTATDIFDALTCKRRYKRPWSVEESFEYLNSLAGDKIDADCIAAMNSARERITAACHAQSGSDAPRSAPP